MQISLCAKIKTRLMTFKMLKVSEFYINWRPLKMKLGTEN